MYKRQRNLLILAIVIILIILLLIFWPRGEKTDNVINDTPVVAEVVDEEEQQLAPLIERATPTPNQASAEAVARIFSERFTSFSYQSDFANIKDVYPLMTDSFRVEQELYVASTPVSDEYYGVSSDLISLDTTMNSNTSAVMDAYLQRVESKRSTTNTSTKYETLRLNLVFENGSWLVDGANWLK